MNHLLMGIVGTGLVLTACATMPTNVVDPRSYLGAGPAAPVTEAPRSLAAPYEAVFRAYQKVPPLTKVLVADLQDDERYSMIEFQFHGVGTAGAYRAILYQKAPPGVDGPMDDLYAPGDTALESWRHGELIPQERVHFLPLEVRWEASGPLDLQARFEDPFHRNWEVSFRDTRLQTPPSAVLAPVADRIKDPGAFPLIAMEDITLVPLARLRSTVLVDGSPRRVSTFPVLMNGEISSFVRYSSKVTALEVLATREPPASEPVPPRFFQDGQGRISQVSWVPPQGGQEVILRFEPGLPDLRTLAPGRGLEGRWLLGTASTPATTGGRFTLSTGHDGPVFSLSVDLGWSPYPGKPWMTDFSFRAQGRPTEAGIEWTAVWNRSQTKNGGT